MSSSVRGYSVCTVHPVGRQGLLAAPPSRVTRPNIGGTKQFWRRNRLKETATTNCVCKWVNGESQSPMGLTSPTGRHRRRRRKDDGRSFHAKTDRFSAIVAYGDRSVAFLPSLRHPLTTVALRSFVVVCEQLPGSPSASLHGTSVASLHLPQRRTTFTLENTQNRNKK